MGRSCVSLGWNGRVLASAQCNPGARGQRRVAPIQASESTTIMGKSWPGARRVDRLKAKQKESQLAQGAPRSEVAERVKNTARVTVADAATTLGMPPAKVLSLVLSGKLEGGREGGKYWVSTKSLSGFKG